MQMCGGFAYHTGYTLTPQSNQWLDYLPASPHRLATTSSDPTQPQATHTTNKLAAHITQAGWLVSLIHHGRTHAGTGISTRYPSTTPVGLALGPDSPWEDELDPGTLGHPADEFPTRHSLLMPAFSLASTPPHDHSAASTQTRRSPTHQPHNGDRCRGFGGVLEPH